MNLLDQTTLKKRGERAWALLAVLSLSATALLVLAGVMTWANANVTITNRNNEYFAASYAAEAATEKALSAISQQYGEYGLGVVNQNLASSAYAENYLPNATDDPYWASFSFSGTNANGIIVTELLPTNQSSTFGGNSIYSAFSAYNGMTMTINTMEIIATAQSSSGDQMVSTVGQKVFLASIPLFQFAIFYEHDMELAPETNMTITGPVHGNGNIYAEPSAGATLTFSNAVGAVGIVTNGEDPLDPSSRSFGTVVYEGADAGGQPPLTVPVGTNTFSTNDPAGTNIYALLQLPQTGGDTNMAANLFYNKADLVIIISNNNTISVTSGTFNNQATVVNSNQWSTWLSTNGSFKDQRDNNLTVNPIIIDVSNLANWSATNLNLSGQLAAARGSSDGNVSSIYVADLRSTSTASITTNSTLSTNYVTNSTTSATYPAGNFAPPVAAGYIVPPVGTNAGTWVSNSVTAPSPGTYVAGTLTTNGSGFNKRYTYETHATSYTYGVISISSINTNYSYLTNLSPSSQPGIVLSNGAVLPSGSSQLGLAVATPDPVYIVGNWNVQTSANGTSDAGQNSTTYTYPSAIYADAVTILSSSWNPANSAAPISSRAATSDTVNAAILTGNVPSNGENYSGGVENFLRFLEDWTGQTLTYNGSLVCLFSSEVANQAWSQEDVGSVYNPPVRNWAYDTNFNNPAKQPPMMPDIRTVLRSQWTLLAPYTASF